MAAYGVALAEPLPDGGERHEALGILAGRRFQEDEGLASARPSARSLRARLFMLRSV